MTVGLLVMGLAACAEPARGGLDGREAGAAVSAPATTAMARPMRPSVEPGTPQPAVPDLAVPVLTSPVGPTTVVAGVDATSLALATSQALFETAPVVVVAPADDAAAQTRAASTAVALGMPLVLTSPSDAALAEEVGRLEAQTILTFGSVPGELSASGSATSDSATSGSTSSDLTAERLEAPADDADLAAMLEGERLSSTSPADPLADVLVLTTGEPHQVAAAATARAAGAQVVTAPGGDPRATSESVQAVAAAAPTHTVGLGSAFVDAQTLGWRVAAAATGVELPGGGQLVLPGKTYVALYGTPVTSSLGVLGEQGPEATVRRAREQAAPYQDLTDTTVVPALEIIATVAAGEAGADGDYSNERPIEELRPLVDLARENGQYVVLDLQPGRSDFLSQAQEYEELLREPHVGLALDPEWRLEPDQVHLSQIGQVDVEEVDEVVTWLADLTRKYRLPQKLLTLHQFQVRMIPGVDAVDRSRSELAVLVHMDGQGSQSAKQDTWRVLRDSAPSITWWGWKNFFDEDSPMLTPEQTMQVEPTPHFISYQ